MWKISYNRIDSYRCMNCTCYATPYCRDSISLLLSMVGICGKYSCNWTHLYRNVNWSHLLKSNTANIIVMKKEYTEEILKLGEDFGVNYPECVDKVYLLPLPPKYIKGRRNTNECINIIIYPE